MTQPTQAQIEAAAKAIHALELEHGYIEREWRGIDVETEYAAMAKAALSEVDKVGKDTDAMLVGEPAQSDELLGPFSRQLVKDTIERCAQVADKMHSVTNHYSKFTGKQIAAAIRKLKDAP